MNDSAPPASPEQSPAASPELPSAGRARIAVLESILGSAADAVVAYDRELRYAYVSPSAAHIIGAPVDSLLGRRSDETQPPSLAAPWQALARRVLDTGVTVRDEIPYSTGGGLRIFEYIMSPVRDERGAIALVVSVARDVTEQRRAQQALAEANQAEQRARRRASRLQELAAALAGATVEAEVGAAIADAGAQALDAEAAVAYLRDGDGRYLLCAAHGLSAEALAPLRVLSLDAPVPLADAIRTGQPIWLESHEALLARYPNLREAHTPAGKLRAVAAIPLQGHDDTIGGIAFSFGTGHTFDEDERRFLLTLASHAALAAERCRLRRVEEAARNRLAILAAASRRFSEARLEMRDTLDIVAREVASQLGGSCAINLLSADGQVLEPVAIANIDPAAEAATRATLEAAPVRMDEGSTLARVAGTGRPILIAEIPDGWVAAMKRPEYRAHHERFPIGTLLVVPLSARGAIIGTVTASRGPAGPAYTPDDLSLLEDLAARAALAIANARQHEELALERRRLDLLARASELLAASLDYETTLENVIGLALPTLGDFGFFDVCEASGEVRRVPLAYRDPRRQSILEKTRWVRSERRDKILCALSRGLSGFHPDVDDLWLADVAESPEHLALMKELAFGSMITVPLAYHSAVLGSLTLFFVAGGRKHGPADLRLAEELARRAAAAVENSRLFTEAREAVAVRDDFLSIAGHELKTPLAALGLQIESLKRLADKEQVSGRFGERLGKTEGNVARLERLVNELLDVSRITGGRLAVEREPMDLVATVRDAVERLAPQAASAGCELRLSGLPELHGRWDRLRLDQVVTNLVGNAIKYGRGKPIEVSVAADPQEARIAVRDHGIGISPDDEARIFGRFERAVSHRHYGGLGLGLWIARQIVEAHGGSIQFERPADVGTRFIVELPLDGA